MQVEINARRLREKCILSQKCEKGKRGSRLEKNSRVRSETGISRLVSFSTRYAVRPTTSSDGVLRPRAQPRRALEAESRERETSLHGWSILLTHALYKSCKVHTKDNSSRPDGRIR